MKTDQILAAAKKWAKENKYKIKAKIEKAPPAWVQSEDQSQGAGVTVTIPKIDPIPCEVWLQETAGKVFISRKSKAWEIYRIKKITEVGGGLTNAVGTHQLFAIFDIIEEWADANGYEIGDQSLKEGYEDSYEYGRKDDPHVQDGEYPSTISFTGEGKLLVDRKIGESRPMWGGQTGSWYFPVATCAETKPDKIKKWLDENAKTGLYKDILITHLDKKTAKKIIRENSVSWGDIHLYELELATDEAIEVLCKYRGTLQLSEKSFLSLTDSQIQKLIESTNLYHEKDILKIKNLIVEVGIFLQGEVPEDVCKKIIKHPICKHGGGHYYFNHNAKHISDECAAILAQSSAEIRYEDSSVESAVESVGMDLIEKINDDLKNISGNDCQALLKHHKSAYTKLRKVFGDFHSNTLVQLSLLRDVQLELGELDDALASEKKQIDAILAVNGPCRFLSPPERKYAHILCDLGRYPEAISIFQRLWKDYLKHSKIDDCLNEKTTSVSRHYIIDYCDSLVGNQQYADALKVINRAIKVSTEVNGAEHVETLNLQENKAVILVEKGDVAKASKIFSEIYSWFREHQGPMHEYTIQIMDRHACTLHMLAVRQKKLPNKYSEEAEALYADLLKHYKKKGKAHMEDAARIADNLKNLTQK